MSNENTTQPNTVLFRTAEVSMQLKRALMELTQEFLSDRERPEIIELLTEDLHEFITLLVSKYAIGCIEHADSSILALDYDRESKNELADLVVYTYATKWKHRLMARFIERYERRPLGIDGVSGIGENSISPDSTQSTRSELEQQTSAGCSNAPLV